MSAECTLKDVKYSPLLCCSPFFLFNLTISLSLSPDCIRIDCNLSKCLLCSIYCTMIMSTYTAHCGTTNTCCLLRFLFFVFYDGNTKGCSCPGPQFSLFTVCSHQDETAVVFLWRVLIGSFSCKPHFSNTLNDTFCSLLPYHNVLINLSQF